MIINPLNMRGLDLKKERENRSWTQDYFAELASVTKRTVINWEQSEEISASKVKLIQAILDEHTPKSEKYSREEINKKLEETREEYKDITSQFKKTGKDLIDLSLEVVDNWDELKKLKHIQNLIKLDVLEAERQENIKR